MNPIDYWYKKYIALKECERIPKPELTWEDIRKIVILFSEVTAELFDKADANEMCKETLRRFNEYKERKK